MTTTNPLASQTPATGRPSSLTRAPWPRPTTDPPTEDEMMEWVMDIEYPEATDGCTIEPDGVCEHGHPSWMLRLGLI